MILYKKIKYKSNVQDLIELLKELDELTDKVESKIKEINKTKLRIKTKFK